MRTLFERLLSLFIVELRPIAPGQWWRRKNTGQGKPYLVEVLEVVGTVVLYQYLPKREKKGYTTNTLLLQEFRLLYEFIWEGEHHERV